MKCSHKKCDRQFETEVELKEHLKRSHLPKIFTKPTERYEKGEIPTIDKQELAYLHTYGCGTYPACKKHGALLAYLGNVWRCIECGWAIEYKKPKKVR